MFGRQKVVTTTSKGKMNRLIAKGWTLSSTSGGALGSATRFHLTSPPKPAK